MGQGGHIAGNGDGAQGGVSYGEAAHIQPDERDRKLDVNAENWPPPPPSGWEPAQHGFRRRIDRDKSPTGRIPAELEELILRFPSAPIHGLQRLHGHHMKLSPSENFHTFRVLRSGKPGADEEKVKRIFLMHTGLNERDTMGLYYRLASQLISEEPRTVCIVRPFPGHMTRYPFGAFAETPLDLYLWDGSHLFRQFMRSMVEAQWLLSALVRRSSFRCASGANLLGESDDTGTSRLDAGHLAREVFEDWKRLHLASVRTAASEGEAEGDGAPAAGNGSPPEREPVNVQEASEGQIEAAISGLRETLHLERDFEDRGGDLDPQEDEESEPSLHAIGYSLGGFAAQSVFMSWPFAVASCTSMLAGGALRELAPTGFADPEEWQTVLHSLRYELDDRMMSTHIDVEDNHVAGIDRELFTYLKRTFYEVFQQEYRGSIQTRYEAFGDRMFFIVGGDDPVMRPETVLQSGPKGGLNLLEVGGLGHFLQDGSGSEDDSRRTFGLPEMAALIHRFAENAAVEHEEQRPLTWLKATQLTPLLSRSDWQEAVAKQKGKVRGRRVLGPLSTAELIEIDHEGALSGELFERCLDDLVHRISEKGDGALFVLRNEVPTVFRPEQAVREAASALYHDDLSIVRYCHGISAREEVLEENVGRLCLVLPWNAPNVMQRMDAQRGFPSQAESAGGGVMDRITPEEVCDKALKQCLALAQRNPKGAVRIFNGNGTTEAIEECLGDESKHLLRDLVKGSRAFTRVSRHEVVPSLPDCWIWVSSETLAQGNLTRNRSIDGLLAFAADISSDEQKMLEHIRDDRIRIVNVSRARYNPRFRGRLLVDGKAARKRIVHAALCVGLSEPIRDKTWQEAFAKAAVTAPAPAS